MSPQVELRKVGQPGFTTEALRLPERERAVLADRLLESLVRLPSELEAAWIREADERIVA